MTQIKIKRIDFYTKDKNGQPLQGKFGPVTKIRIIDEAGTQFWGYGNKITFDYQVGQGVKVNVEPNNFKGKDYNNFKPLTEQQEFEEKVNVRLKRLEDKVFGNSLPSLSDEDAPVEDALNTDDDLPDFLK